MEKVRLLRSTLTTKIKDSMFSIFGNLLDPINTKAKPEEVLNWKRSEKTKNCFKLLFARVANSSDENDTYVVRILNRIWPSGETTDHKTAYAMAVCQSILSPNYEKLMISEDIVKEDLERYQVIIIIIIIIIISIIIIY